MPVGAANSDDSWFVTGDRLYEIQERVVSMEWKKERLIYRVYLVSLERIISSVLYPAPAARSNCDQPKSTNSKSWTLDDIHLIDHFFFDRTLLPVAFSPMTDQKRPNIPSEPLQIMSSSPIIMSSLIVEKLLVMEQNRRCCCHRICCSCRA